MQPRHTLQKVDAAGTVSIRSFSFEKTQNFYFRCETNPTGAEAVQLSGRRLLAGSSRACTVALRDAGGRLQRHRGAARRRRRSSSSGAALAEDTPRGGAGPGARFAARISAPLASSTHATSTFASSKDYHSFKAHLLACRAAPIASALAPRGRSARGRRHRAHRAARATRVG